MDTSSKVNLIHEKTLFEQLYCLLEVLFLLIDHSKVIVSVDVCARLFESLFKAGYCLIYFVPLVIDSAHTDKCVCHILIDR